MTDRELLELAAKAARIEIVGLVNDMIAQPDHREGGFIVRNERGGDSCWNPLTDDGDALRLAVKCGIIIEYRPEVPACFAYHYNLKLEVMQRPDQADPDAAARRAIVRVAAEIGRGMK